MQQLGALENLMIEGELPYIPMHMSALLIYATGGKRRSRKLYSAIQSGVATVVESHFPILRCKLEAVPLQLDKSYWVEDPGFSASYHISRIALPKSHDWQELYQLFSQFHARPLDHTRPLWEAVYVEGLDNLEGVPRGSSALFMKIHHGVMDGKGAQRLMSSFHSLSPDQGAPLIADSFSQAIPGEAQYRPPTALVKYGRAWWHSIERPLDLVSTLVKLIPKVSEPGEGDKPAATQLTPQTPFNQPVGAERVVGHVRMEIKPLQALQRKYRCTINDIALCVVAGGIRDYLLQRNELPEADMQALMPVNLRRKKEDGSIGNHVSIAKVPLYTGIESPSKRLAAIHTDALRHKKRIKQAGASPAMQLLEDIHPAILLSLGKWLVSSGHLDDLPLTVNTVVSNVPGIPKDAYLDGVKLIDYLGFGPLAPNMAMFHTVSSTEDHVNISFLSNPEIIGDGGLYRLALEQSWQAISQS